MGKAKTLRERLVMAVLDALTDDDPMVVVSLDTSLVTVQWADPNIPKYIERMINDA